MVSAMEILVKSDKPWDTLQQAIDMGDDMGKITDETDLLSMDSMVGQLSTLHYPPRSRPNIKTTEMDFRNSIAFYSPPCSIIRQHLFGPEICG